MFGKLLKGIGSGAKWLVADGRGAGLLVAGAGVLTGNPVVAVKGAQLAAAGVVKHASKAAGRGVHRFLSPATAMLVGGVGLALGVDSPLTEAALQGNVGGLAEAAGVAAALFLDGALVSGVQSVTKNGQDAVRDYRVRRAL